MADIVNLGDRLKAQREETARFDLTAKMIPDRETAGPVQTA